jgi:hypothetical protein
MALRNPYFDDHEDAYTPMRRNAIVDQLAPESPQARPRTPTRTPQQTREMLEGPGGHTLAVDQPDYSNAYTGDVGSPGGDLYTPPVAEPRSTGAQPRTQGGHPSNPQRGFQLMDAYDDPYTRRNEGSPGVGASAARGASIGSGAGPIGAGVGAAAGAIAALFSKNAPTAMTDFRIEDARQIISQAHRDALGREITPQELDQTIRGQGWEPGDRWMGQDQLAYVLDQFAQHAAAEQAARGPETAASSATTPTGAQAGATGGGLPFSGFDFNRAQDPSKSAKDAFASLAQQAPQLADTSKAGAEAWFRQHIAPGMEAAGYKVFDVQGDKAWVGAREDPEGRVPVDFLINAGGSNPQIGWQPDGGGAAVAAGDAPGDIAGAYEHLKSIAHPGMSRAEMESAVAQAFGNVPGFEKAYAGDVVINGRKIDLITDFEGANPQWSDNLSFVPLHGGATSGGKTNGVIGAGTMAGTSLAPGVSLASPLGNSNVLQEIMAEIQRLQRGEAPRAAIINQLGAVG